MGVGFVALWMAEIISPTPRAQREDWRETERKIQAEKSRMRDAFNPQYSAAWKDLDIRMRQYNTADWSGIFLIFGMCLVPSPWDELGIFRVLLACSVVAALLYGRSYFGKRVNNFHCPRCEKPFICIEPQARSPFYDLHKSGRRGT